MYQKNVDCFPQDGGRRPESVESVCKRCVVVTINVTEVERLLRFSKVQLDDCLVNRFVYQLNG